MKSQKHNQGKLVEVTIKMDEELREALRIMSKNSGLSEDELVVVALKRFRSHHADYEGSAPRVD